MRSIDVLRSGIAKTSSVSFHHTLLIGVILFASLSPVRGAMVNVTNTADSGPGTLRAALGAANNGDIIYATGISGAILLTSGQLSVTTSVTILGAGHGSLAVDGNGTNRIFSISGGPTVLIAGLTLTNGISPGLGGGGAILNAGSTLTISNCLIIGNQGGAILNAANGFSAAVRLYDATVTGNTGINGGAIYNNGGAVATSAEVDILNSTISGNTSSFGGAIYNHGASGGASILVFNSTFSQNHATNSDSGIYNAGSDGSTSVFLGSTILNATRIVNSGTIQSDGYNLCSDDESAVLFGTTDIFNTDPMLGPLKYNGGLTPTHALLIGSPALDQGKNLGNLATDQRGSPRVVDLCPNNAAGGDGTDIGAYEVASLVVPSTITVLNTNDSGSGSLREAILLANTCPDFHTIDFAPSAYGTIKLNSSEPPITNPLFINGPGATNVIINGNSSNEVFYIAPGLNVTIAGVTISNGTNVYGGGIYNNHSVLTVSNCAISGNSAVFGGGIYSDGTSRAGATLAVVSSTISSNVSSDSGGGLYNDGEGGGNATMTVVNSTFSGNSTVSSGAAIWNTGTSGNATLAVNACTFSGNQTTVNTSASAGAIYSEGFSGGASLQIADTILNAGARGANLVNESGSFTSLGYNLSSDNGNGLLNGPADQINTNPHLGPLQNNGGPTLTFALLTGSPAIDQGKLNAIPSLAANTDQRGVSRPIDMSGIANAVGGDGSDIGAFEAQNVAIRPILISGTPKFLSGTLQFSFTNAPGAGFTVLSSTNLALSLTNWTALGTPAEVSPGQYQYTDLQATNQPRRFYTIRSP